jgi:polyisoprenoid-binding protein YceI
MATTETLTIAPAGAWRLDPVHSTIGFEVPYLAGIFKGHFRDVDAEIDVDGERAQLWGTAQVASVDVRDENLATHLASPDFFDAERHPELRFTAEDVALDGTSVTVHGEISIKGVTKPLEATGTVAAPLTDPYGRERLGLTLSAVLDRTAFGVSWNLPLPSGEPALANEVTIVAELQFVKAA